MSNSSVSPRKAFVDVKWKAYLEKLSDKEPKEKHSHVLERLAKEAGYRR